MISTLYGIGTGPGDPELMTLKAVRILRQSSVVVIPRDRHGKGLAATTAAQFLPHDYHEIPLSLPCYHPNGDDGYRQAAAAILPHLIEATDIAILCEGDPMLYGSFLGLIEALAQQNQAGPGYQIEIVPGISSVMAAAAAAQIGLTRGQQSFTVIPATLPDDSIRARLADHDSAAILKVGRHFGRIRHLLNAIGRAKHSLHIAHISTDEQSITPLLAVKDDEAAYFSLILVAPPR